MKQSPEGPGAVLVVLRRLDTSTDVMLLPVGLEEPPLPCAAARSGQTQRDLVERLIRESGIEAARLYGSTLMVAGRDGPLGVFVAFAGADASNAASAGDWTDLRESCRALASPWGPTLSEVRARFVAQAPDEALRIA